MHLSESDRYWCEACRDNFPVRHYDDDRNHKAGAEFGPVGARMERERGATSKTQWRVMFPGADPDMVGVQWHDEPPTDQDLAEWRECFACELWIERRTVVEYGPERDHSFDAALALPTTDESR